MRKRALAWGGVPPPSVAAIFPRTLITWGLLFVSVVAAGAQESNFTSAFVARWNLSHGKYQVDIGQYLEALEAFDTAMEMSGDDDVRAEALLQKANVLAVFLDAQEDAIRVYDDLVNRFPRNAVAEAALFRAGMVLFDGGKYDKAGEYFERYIKAYPTGASRGSAEFLAQQARSRHPAPVAAPAQPMPVMEVRVRIMKGHGSVRVASEGVLNIRPVSAAGRTLDLTARSGMVVAGGQAGVREVTLSSEQPIEIRAGSDTRHYRGSLTVRADGNNLQLVNRVNLEEYLYGVVTKESVPSWPIESLKAQAVASRTYALYQVRHRQDRDYDMVDDEGSQVYGGVEGESAAARRAVDETRGTILVHRGKPIYAMFTANTGWHTGDPAYIFDQPLPYLTAVPDQHSPGQQLGRWTRTHKASEIRRKLSDIGVQLGEIRSIEPRVTCPSGRIVRVDVVDDRGSHVMRTRPTLGRALKLPDILLNVRRDGDQFVFSGGGFGHGVGLSQWGAKSMADKGMSAKDILAFYYRGAEMTTPTR